MANNNSTLALVNIKSETQPRAGDTWTTDTTDFFHLRLAEIGAVLSVLIRNIGEFEKEDGRASDEAIFLAIQHTYTVMKETEAKAYTITSDTGEISLCLMQARALLEIIEGMFFADEWAIGVSDGVLINYLASVRRLVEQSVTEATRLNVHHFPKAA